MKITVKERQTLLDIALMTAGTVAAAIGVAEANGWSLTDELSDGQVLEVPEPTSAREAQIVRRYRAQSVEPATEASADDLGLCAYGGINFMGIEIDFEVS